MAPPAAAALLQTEGGGVSAFARVQSPATSSKSTHISFRHKDLSPVGSDTDSASDAGSVGESQVSTAISFSPQHFHRQLQRDEQFTSGAQAVLQVAGNISENVFLYPLLSGSSPVAEDTLRARVVTLEIRQGAASAVRGALAVSSDATALVPSQTLPLFVPNIFQIAQEQKSAVFHVGCESIRQDLSIGNSYEAIYALQHSGAILLNSSSPQECHDLAVVAHVAALRLKKLLIHFYDSSRVARELTKIRILAPSALKTIADSELALTGSSVVETIGVAEQVQAVMDDLFQVLQKQYNIYEYHGAPDAEAVIVVMGEATSAMEAAVAYEQMLGVKVGVVQVRLLLPWSHALFAASLPSTVQRVAVLENVSMAGFSLQRGLLTQNVQVFFHSPYWTASTPVTVLTGIYGGVFQNSGFTVGMARGVLQHLSNSTTRRRTFAIAKSQAALEHAAIDTVSAFPHMDVILGEAYELETSDVYAKDYLFWGFDEETQRGANLEAAYRTTLELLNRNPTTQVSAVINHTAPTADLPRALSTLEVRLTRAGQAASSSLQQTISQADVTVVTRAALLEDFDIATHVKVGGTLLVHANWKTVDDIEISGPFKATIAAKRAQVLVVDVDELATRIEDDTIADVAAHVAFLKAAALYDERVVFALLQHRFPPALHPTLRSFVSAVWGEVIGITYPVAEWLAQDEDREEEGSEKTETATSSRPRSLSSLTLSKLSHSVLGAAKLNAKRARGPAISKATTMAWRLLFPDAYATRQGVRDHVTDIVRVTKWERLTPEDYERNVFHIEMDITNTAIKYNIGEALAVFAHNEEKEVLAFLRSYDVEPEALVTLPVATKSKKGVVSEPQVETLTYFQLFSQVLDVFGRPSKKFYQALAALATDDKEKATLSQLLEAEGKDEYKRRVDETLTFADLLTEFPSARPTMAQLLTLIPRIKPRHYSIASSMKMNPTSVHLLIVVHDWKTPSGRYRIGQATRFLSSIQPGQLLSVSVCSSVMKLPVNPADPIIMAGLGTGMAPFRAFIQERAFLKAQGVTVGPIALYFGSRHKAKEFLYGDELEQYEREGLVTYLRCAFSRDQAHKIYIQDRIAEDKDILADLLLRKNGHFYLCGPTWPVADVREALITSFTSVGGMDRKQANAYIEKMREEGRYVLEVY